MLAGSVGSTYPTRYENCSLHDPAFFASADELRPGLLHIEDVRARAWMILRQRIEDCLSAAGGDRGALAAIEPQLAALELSHLADAGLLATCRRKLRRIWERPAPIGPLDLDAIGVIADVVRRFERDEWSDLDETALVRIAFELGINPTRFVPCAFGFGETLAVACWLGDLARHVPVAMPGFVVAYWDALLADEGDWPVTDWGPDAYLIAKAASVMSASALQDWIAASRYARVVARRDASSRVMLEPDASGASADRRLSPSFC